MKILCSVSPFVALALLGAAEAAPAYPPLPKVERYRLTDEQFFEKLDPAHPAMAAVLAALREKGPAAAKAALAKHFRERTAPKWHIDPHARPRHAARPEGVDTRDADQALKHVYRGHAFGPDIDWLDNPSYAPGREFDKEWSMAFLRMPWWDDLGRAYWATGEEKYAREYVTQFLDFARKHPIPVKRTSSSSHPLKYAVPEWRTLEIGIRLGSAWTNPFFRFLSSPSVDDDALCEMLKSFWEMADHMRRFSSMAELSSNWLVFETNGLYTAAVLFPEFGDAAEWRKLAEERLVTEVQKQVYPDGTQWELAPGYGAGVMSLFRAAHSLGRLNGSPMPEAYVGCLERMYHYLMYSSWNGEMAAFSDSGHGSVLRALQTGAEDFPAREDFRWLATEGREGKAPTETHAAFLYSGHYVMRSGWEKDARFLIVDAGPFGTNHQHEDALNFELSAYGERLITDPGSYRYNYDSPWRHFMVSSPAHNTLMVDNLGQCRREKRDTWVARQPSTNVWLPGKEMAYLRAAYADGYGPGGKVAVTHTRSLFFIEGRFWVLIDRAQPQENAEHLYESLFMLNADDAVAEGNRVITKRAGANLLLAAAPVAGQSASVVKGQMEPVRRGWKRGGETVLPNPTAVFARRAAGPATFALVLYPVPAGEPVPNVGIELEGGDEATAVRLTLPGGRRLRVVDDAAKPRVERE